MNNFRLEPSWQRKIGTKSNVVLTDPLATIYNEGQWKVYKVSPLFQLQYEAVKLKAVGAKIRQSIVGNITANSSHKYTVSVNPEPHLKYSEDDPHGLKITVTCSTQELNSKTQLKYTAILLSWGENSNLGEDTAHLPYMLERGEQKIGVAVRSSLQNIFDCNIKQFTFTQNQILTLGMKFLEFDTSGETEKFILRYRTPNADFKDKLSFCFEIGDMRIIWHGANEEANKPSERVRLAYQILQNQILGMVTLDMSPFDLTEVLLPKAEVKANGVVKMKTPDIVNVVFMTLNDICSQNSVKQLNLSEVNQ